MGSFGIALEKLKMGYIQDAAAATKSGLPLSPPSKPMDLRVRSSCLPQRFAQLPQQCGVRPRASGQSLDHGSSSHIDSDCHHVSLQSGSQKSAAATAAYRVKQTVWLNHAACNRRNRNGI